MCRIRILNVGPHSKINNNKNDNWRIHWLFLPKYWQCTPGGPGELPSQCVTSLSSEETTAFQRAEVRCSFLGLVTHPIGVKDHSRLRSKAGEWIEAIRREPRQKTRNETSDEKETNMEKNVLRTEASPTSTTPTPTPVHWKYNYIVQIWRGIHWERTDRRTDGRTRVPRHERGAQQLEKKEEKTHSQVRGNWQSCGQKRDQEHEEVSQ